MNIGSSLQWFYDRLGKVTYSMTYRNGPSSYDCSSAVYYALIQGGFLPQGHRIGNTDSLFYDLEKNGWSQLSAVNGFIDAQRGDVFIWGKRGASGGAAGHTGMFTDENNIIHCSAGWNGIHVDNHDYFNSINGGMPVTIYRYTGTSQNHGIIDQVLYPGSIVKFEGAYTTNDAALIGGVWQIRSNELAGGNFNWEDYGIPVEPLVEVDAEGYATTDQHLDEGSKFKIPGKFTIHDIRGDEVLIDWSGLKFWVKAGPVTEISSSDPGTPVPGQRATETPPETPEQPEPTPDTSPEPESPTEPPEQPQEQIEEPEKVKEEPKEEPMAFSQEQQQQLQVATQAVLDSNTEFTPVISDKVKTVAYFATDAIAIVSGLVFTLLAIFGVMDAIIAITVNAAITAALIGLKQTFRLSSKKQ
jgi:hypothetical protein